MKKTVILFLILGIVVIISGLNYDGEATKEVKVIDNNEELIIPVTAHLISDGTSEFTTERDFENINNLFEQANSIWSPAKIRFVVEDVKIVNIENEDFKKVLSGNLSSLVENNYFERDTFNGYFAYFINVNGQAFPENGMFFVGDITTVNDFRTTAHELGHLLGLKHVNTRSFLMFKGSNGESLSEEEIEFARKNAILLFS